MNPFFARFLSSVYRKEPISGFLLILGGTDLLLGEMGGRTGLLSFGLIIALLGLGMRKLQTRKVKLKIAKQKRRYSRYQLPPSVRQPLPLLVRKKSKRSR